MKSHSQLNHLLQADGTSQQQRLLPWLQPDSILLDERRLQELLAYTYELAAVIQYYTIEGATKDGGGNPLDWRAFFDAFHDGSTPDKVVWAEERIQAELAKRTDIEPHFALFLCFLELFKVAQIDLNTLTQRHLDHYYQDILHLDTKTAEADHVHLVLELAKNFRQHRVEKGVAIDADKDAAGNALTYRTTDEIIINPAQVAELKSVYVDQAHYAEEIVNGQTAVPEPFYARIYAAPQANSADGQGAELEEEEPKWYAFGTQQIDEEFVFNPAPKSPYHQKNELELLEAAKIANNMVPATIGFAIASPQLLLREGDRKITLTVKLRYKEAKPILKNDPSPTERAAFNLDLANYTAGLSKVNRTLKHFIGDSKNTTTAIPNDPHFDVFLSGEEEWLNNFSNIQIRYLDPTDSSHGHTIAEDQVILCLSIDLLPDAPAIVPYNDEVLLEGYQTEWPMLKVLLKETSDSYDALSQLVFEEVEIEVDVKGVKDLIVQNDTSLLDASSAFMPFGPQPKIGGHLYVGNQEVFQKKLTNLGIQLTWEDIPSDFQTHYNEYPGDIDFDSFKCSFELLYDKDWLKPLDGTTTLADQNLFIEDQNNVTSPSKKVTIPFKDSLNKGTGIEYSRRPDTKTFSSPLNTNTLRGFGRLTLEYPFDAGDQVYYVGGLDPTTPLISTSGDPNDNTEVGKLPSSYISSSDFNIPVDALNATLNAFGHKQFPNLYTQQAIKHADAIQKGNTPPNLPNAPYTPVLQSISLDYTSTETISLADLDNNPEQLFSITPFGHVQRTTANAAEAFLLPQFDGQGNFYVGVENFTSKQLLSILFQIAEGSAAVDSIATTDDILKPEDVQWSYLAGDRWVDFPSINIVKDSTLGLQRSGIITFSVPSAATDAHTYMPSGKHWLKATIASDIERANQFIAVHTQAVEAELALPEDADTQIALEDHLTNGLPAEQVKGLIVKDALVKKITQPYRSFDGRAAEASAHFYTRASERLRHKHRAWTCWDYEHLVLERFPSAYKVKCVNFLDFKDIQNAVLTARKNVTASNEICIPPPVEDAPGHVTVVVVSNIRNQNVVNPLEPKTSLNKLYEIEQYLATIKSRQVNIRAVNPTYERIQIVLDVAFKVGFDPGFYEGQLNTELKQFLSPWAFEEGEDIVFSNSIYKSDILSFIEGRTYVDHVLKLQLIHYFDEKLILLGGIGYMRISDNFVVEDVSDSGQESKDVDKVEAIWPTSILVSHTDHTIRHIEDIDAEDCDGFDALGICTMAIGKTFILEDS